MFLKNTSTFLVGIRTKKGNINVKPNEVIQIMEANLIDINSHLEITDEAEFTKYQKTLLNKEIKELKVPEKKNENNDVPEKCKECYADGKTPDSEECEKCKTNGEAVDEGVVENNTAKGILDKVVDAVKNVTENHNADSLDVKLQELQAKWQATKNTKEKVAIAKEIKALQEKINKAN